MRYMSKKDVIHALHIVRSTIVFFFFSNAFNTSI